MLAIFGQRTREQQVCQTRVSFDGFVQDAPRFVGIAVVMDDGKPNVVR